MVELRFPMQFSLFGTKRVCGNKLFNAFDCCFFPVTILVFFFTQLRFACFAHNFICIFSTFPFRFAYPYFAILICLIFYGFRFIINCFRLLAN